MVMPIYDTSGIYEEDIMLGHGIEPASTSVTAFVGTLASGLLLEPLMVRSWLDFEDLSGGLSQQGAMTYAVRQFFENGGTDAIIVRAEEREGVDAADIVNAALAALDAVDFDLLCLLPFAADTDIPPQAHFAAAGYCEKRLAFYIADAPRAWTFADRPVSLAREGIGAFPVSSFAAAYFPRLLAPDPLDGDRVADFAPSGAVAGVFARTDAQRGVWKAPAGIEATILGDAKPAVLLNNRENGVLNPLAVNCLRVFQEDTFVWGARTLAGGDTVGSEWKYVPVRRLALFVEKSVRRGIEWAVFEPNDERLWAAIRLRVGAFMDSLFRTGAFPGNRPDQAYFVKCDRSTMTQLDLDEGIIKVEIGFAPLKPAEFVIISLSQLTGSAPTR